MESSGLDDRFSCCGIPISRMDLKSAEISIFENFYQKKPRVVRLVNAFSIASALESPKYYNELKSEGLNLLDSKNISRIYGLLFRRLAPVSQVRGSNLLLNCLENKSEVRNVFIGSTENTLKRMQLKISKLFPWQSNAFYYSPPFLDDLESLILDISTNVSPQKNDLIWLSLGTPKQDHVALKLAYRWDKTVVAIGAAFDFLAENFPECPKLIRILGLEWLFRLYLEPVRLWKRYFFGNLIFLKNVAKYFFIDNEINKSKK